MAIVPCGVGSFQVAAATSTSQAQCEPCAAGTSDIDQDVTTECETCPAGTYIPTSTSGKTCVFVAAALLIEPTAM
jgi:hypothetical protein